MKDRRYIDELTLDELEAALRMRRRDERLKRLGQKGPSLDLLSEGSERRQKVTGPERSRPVVTNNRYSAQVEERRRRRGPIQWRWIWNQVLLLVELLALVGFLFVVAQLFVTLRGLNEESRRAQAQPTPTPTPMIGVMVLPGGHTPPDAHGNTEPTIPPHLRGLVAQVTPLPAPTPGPEQAQRIVIPAIAVDAPIVEGDDWESLKKGAAHHIGSANPGERGNCFISAHNDVYGEIFRDLPELKIGDEVFVHTQSQVYRYVVKQSRIIEPTDVSVMAATSSPVLTMLSCYPYGVDTHRIVVIAELVP